jgi:hypothetical protein
MVDSKKRRPRALEGLRAWQYTIWLLACQGAKRLARAPGGATALPTGQESLQENPSVKSNATSAWPEHAQGVDVYLANLRELAQ